MQILDINSGNSGMVFNIQRYSIHDGPGIRTTVFLKGCPLRCFWCQNPESQHVYPELFFTAEKCVNCGRCVPACPSKANRIDAQGQIQIDRSKCIGCGKCVPVCPEEARSIMGKRMTVDEVVKEVIKDKNFYITSNGGVTVSGGDAVAQPKFAAALLKRCKEEGLHTVIETSGYAPWETFESILEYTDLVYMDIKCIDSELHQRCTGVSNELILQNAVKASQIRTVRFRTPVIPRFNDDPEEIKKIALFVKEKTNSDSLELLKYNNLCESKYIRLDKEFTAERDLPPDDKVEAHMSNLREIVDSNFSK